MIIFSNFKVSASRKSRRRVKGEKMWKLKVSESKEDEVVRSVNNHIGRQFWEFDPNLGSKQEQAQVEEARKQFKENRFKTKHSSDLLMRLQVHLVQLLVHFLYSIYTRVLSYYFY